jgi:hypothetical protein
MAKQPFDAETSVNVTLVMVVPLQTLGVSIPGGPEIECGTPILSWLSVGHASQ